MDSRIVVLARNAHDFQRWCRSSGLSPSDRDVVFASHPAKLLGIDSAKVIRCPGWNQRADASQLDDLARILEQRRTP